MHDNDNVLDQKDSCHWDGKCYIIELDKLYKAGLSLTIDPLKFIQFDMSCHCSVVCVCVCVCVRRI